MTHWSHPNFFAYFPCITNDVAIASDLFTSAFHNPGFDWHCSPANTELETVISDWIVKGLGLDDKFLFSSKGGGMVTNTISDGLFCMVHNAKRKMMDELNMKPNDPRQLKFIGYYTEFSHKCVEKAL